MRQKSSRIAHAFNIKQFSRHVLSSQLFLLPRPWLSVPVSAVLKHQPLARGEGAMHVCQFLHRAGGRTYVKGRIAHADDQAIFLPYWHQVVGER